MMNIEAFKLAKYRRQDAEILFQLIDPNYALRGIGLGAGVWSGVDDLKKIDKIDKNKVTINYGIFTTKTSTNKLELVEKSKK